MKTLEQIFETETGKKSKIVITDGVHIVGIEKYSEEYVQWLEAKLQPPEVKQGDVEIAEKVMTEFKGFQSTLTITVRKLILDALKLKALQSPEVEQGDGEICGKCKNSDIYIRFVEAGKYFDEGMMGYLKGKAKKDSLYHYCRKCAYWWTTDVEAIHSSKEFTEESVEFIQWVMAKTNWRHYDDDATTWTDGESVVTTKELIEKYRNRKVGA